MGNVSEKEPLLINEVGQENDNSNLTEKRKRRLQSFKGVIATFAQVLFFTASATSVQLLERRIPVLELNTFRNAVPAMLYTLGILYTKKWPVIQRDKIMITFLYTVVTFMNGRFFFIAITLLPAGIVSSVVNTSCILFSLLAFSLCSNERVTPKAVLLCTLCLCGVILVIQPWTESSDKSMDMNISTTEVNCNTTATTVTSPRAATTTGAVITPSSGDFTKGKEIHGKVPFAKMYHRTFPSIIGYAFAVISGVTLSLDVLLVKRKPYFSAHILELLFWIFVSNTCFSIILMFIIETSVLPSNWFDVAMVTIHSFSYAGIWPLYIYGPNHISGNTVMAIMNTQVAFMLIAQYTMLSSILPGHRNWMEVAGVILVLAGSGASSVFEMFKNRTRDNEC